MSYCIVSDVQGLNPKREYSPTSTPNLAQVNTLIDTISDEIDLVLSSAGYTVPATGTAFVSALKRINAYGAAALAEMAMFPESSGMGETPHWKILLQIYQGWIKSLQEGKVPADLDVGAPLPVGSNYTVSGLTDFPDPVFRKSEANLPF